MDVERVPLVRVVRYSLLLDVTEQHRLIHAVVIELLAIDEELGWGGRHALGVEDRTFPVDTGFAQIFLLFERPVGIPPRHSFGGPGAEPAPRPAHSWVGGCHKRVPDHPQ